MQARQEANTAQHRADLSALEMKLKLLQSNLASREQACITKENILIDMADRASALLASKEKELDRQILLNRRMPRLQRAIREGLHARLKSLLQQAEDRDRASKAENSAITKREAAVNVQEIDIGEREAALLGREAAAERFRLALVEAEVRGEERLRLLKKREQQNNLQAEALSEKEAAAEMLHKQTAADLVEVRRLKMQITTERRDYDKILNDIQNTQRKISHEKMTLSAREEGLRVRSAKLDERELKLDDREARIQQREDKTVSEERHLAVRGSEIKNAEVTVADMRAQVEASRHEVLAREAELTEREAVVESFMGREAKLAQREEEQDSREDEFFERSAVEVSRMHRREQMVLERVCTQQQEVIRSLRRQLEKALELRVGTMRDSAAIRALEESRDALVALMNPLDGEHVTSKALKADIGEGEVRRDEAEPRGTEVTDLERESDSSTIYVSVVL